MERLDEYGRIRAAAFSGGPWNSPRKPKFCERFGFQREKRVIPVGKDL
ncbi:MAG: hypothetical protein J6330_10540 [Clostridia bacterium]|nr:hypothetical protein [Clostridia bacterium]